MLKFWTSEQFGEFISVVTNPLDMLFFTNQYITGMREGETIALKRADVTADGIKIKNSVSYKVYDNPAGYLVKAPKNKYSMRTSFLPAPLKAMYAEYFKWQYANQKDKSFIYGGDRPVHPNSLRNRFKAYIQKINTANEKANKPLLPEIKIHDLRHSCASYLLNAGVSFQAVAEQLGHKDARETIETYAHLLPAARDKLHEAMEQELPFLQKCSQNVPN